MLEALYEIKVTTGRVRHGMVEVEVSARKKPLTWRQQMRQVYRIVRQEFNVALAWFITYRFVEIVREWERTRRSGW